MPFQTLDPFTQEVHQTFPYDSNTSISAKIEQAEKCFTDWRILSFAERGAYFERLADLLIAKKESIGELVSLEMGKPIKESIAEIEKSALTAKYYAKSAEEMLQPKAMSSKQKAEVHFRPLGVIFGIFPWNYPIWQALRFAIPTLMAGNTAVFKHAENTPQCAQKIEDLFIEAGFPLGAIQHLYAKIEQVEEIIANPYVHAVTLTGSERAGRSVAALAGKYLKKVVLELGGSDPFIVMPDADIRAAAKIGVNSRYQNTGQSCIAAKRFLVHTDVYEPFLTAFEEELDKLQAGDPKEANTTLGVLAREDLSEKLAEQIEATCAAGARLRRGGKRIGKTGFEPGILENIPKNSVAYREELFGPVASFYCFEQEDEAITLANATNFGLGASVWTKNEAQYRRMAAEIESGMVYWNSMVKSTPELPFGGTKNSGIGRELSIFGIHEFTNIQLLYPF